MTQMEDVNRIIICPLWDLRTIGTEEENLGLAMVFTLVTTLRERLSELVRERAERHKAEEHEKERLAIEVRPSNPFA